MSGDAGTVLSAWCVEHLHSDVDSVVFRAGHFSVVAGIVLRDGSRAVVKIRPAAPRLASCARVQEAVHAAGFPAPKLLIPPAPYAPGLAATAETLVEQPGGRGTARAYALLLAEQIRLSPAADTLALDPAPAWVRWDDDEPGLWPTPDDREVDLNSCRIDWIDSAAEAVRSVLASAAGQPVAGHVDWLPQNVWWAQDGIPIAVHDWDSLAALPEPAVAGVAAAIFTENATVDDSIAFLDAYQAAAGTRWTPAQTQAAWAAGLWVRLFDAKKDLLAGRGAELDEHQTQQRLTLIG